jgi:hypothetical protein
MDKNTNSTEKSEERTVETSNVSTSTGLSLEETACILLAVVTLLDKANPQAKVHEQIILMAEAIHEEIYKNRPDDVATDAGATS